MTFLGVGEALPEKNVTAGKQNDFRLYYTAETRAIVADVYREDIELLGYTFHKPLPVQADKPPRRAAAPARAYRFRPHTPSRSSERYKN